jgi:isopentenyldiphosphate isomerase
MSDLIDVLSDSGLRTGEILSRTEIHRLGKHHRAVHLYLFNSQNEILLQRRSLTVDHYPGAYSISVTAHIAAGEFSSDTARRELEEELGVDATPLKIDVLFSYFQEAILQGTYADRQFNDVYVTRADSKSNLIRFNRSEVSEVIFVPFASFLETVGDESTDLSRVYANECRDLLYFLNGCFLNLL